MGFAERLTDWLIVGSLCAILFVIVLLKLVVYFQNWIFFQTHRVVMTDTTVLDQYKHIADCTLVETQCRDGVILRGLEVMPKR